MVRIFTYVVKLHLFDTLIISVVRLFGYPASEYTVVYKQRKVRMIPGPRQTLERDWMLA